MDRRKSPSSGNRSSLRHQEEGESEEEDEKKPTLGAASYNDEYVYDTLDSWSLAGYGRILSTDPRKLWFQAVSAFKDWRARQMAQMEQQEEGSGAQLMPKMPRNESIFSEPTFQAAKRAFENMARHGYHPSLKKPSGSSRVVRSLESTLVDTPSRRPFRQRSAPLHTEYASTSSDEEEMRPRRANEGRKVQHHVFSPKSSLGTPSPPHKIPRTSSHLNTPHSVRSTSHHSVSHHAGATFPQITNRDIIDAEFDRLFRLVQEDAAIARQRIKDDASHLLNEIAASKKMLYRICGIRTDDA